MRIGLRIQQVSRRLACLALLATLAPRPALGFSTDVHKALTERALRGVIQVGNLPVPTEGGLVGFWMWLGSAMASSNEPALDGGDPEKFLARYPEPRAFDAFAIRGFLGFGQEAKPPIWGLEHFDRRDAIDRFNTVIDASAYPDLDQRNQRRYAYDAGRNALKLSDGRHVPADPMILNMGTLEDLSSQAHAHYQLAVEKGSAEPAVLQSEPWNFVIALGFPGPVETYAATMAQMHLDLAVLARTWGEGEFHSEGEYLAMVWLGAGLHYVQDAALPLHTVQVGSYELFKRAQLAHWKQALLTGGGTWGTLHSFAAIGLHYLRNHHLFAEQWLARELTAAQSGKPAAAAVTAAWQAAGQDDPELLKALGDTMKPYLTGEFTMQPWDDGHGGASLLVLALAKLTSRDGGAMYDAAVRSGSELLYDMDFHFPDEALVEARHLGDPQDADVQAGVAELARLHGKAMRRATTAERIYYQLYLKGNSDAAARRLRRTRLQQLEVQEARRKRYLAAVPPASTATVEAPEWLYGELAAGVLLLVGIGGLRSWRARRRAGDRGGPATPSHLAS